VPIIILCETDKSSNLGIWYDTDDDGGKDDDDDV
jgi:hypothetical protein